MWSGVKGTGQFNTEMVIFLFKMDVITPIKKPITALTASIAGNMLSIAGSIGIGFVTLIMGVKFLGEQRFRQAIRVFVMTILIFTGLSICKDAETSGSLFNQVFEADKQIEAAFVRINPVLAEGEKQVASTYQTRDRNGNKVTAELSPAGRMKNAGELIASRIFYTNVYEPYLLMNYGTSNPETVRKKQIEYKDTKYDRINILLDNDVTSDDNSELFDDVTKYEAEELKNRHIMYFKNLENTFFGLFYLVVNLIQMVVYFILAFLRIVIAVMQLFLLPMLPILLLVGLFMTGMNVFANYCKAFGMTIFMKSMAGFACILFASFLSLGFQLSNAVDNPWQKLLTILIYLLAPMGLYLFRTFLGSLFTGRVTLANALAFATHPMSTEKKMRQAAKEKAQENKIRRKQAQEERKAALKKRREAAEKRGAQDLGIKPKPTREHEKKRSALRRELRPQAQHKAPNPVEKAQQQMHQLHEKGQQQEAVAQQQTTRQRQRKAYDKENQQTAEKLAAINQSLGKGATTADKSDNGVIRPSNRRTGQSTKGATDTTSSLRSAVRRNGQRQTPASPDTAKNQTKQRKTTGNRSDARQQHRTHGEKPSNTTVTPKNKRQTNLRMQSGSSGSPRRQTPAVRQKMQAVQQVINAQQPNKSTGGTPSAPASIEPPITRMAKRTAPPIKSKQTPKGVPIRRTKRTPVAPKTTPSMKGMNRPRARK